MKKIIFSICLIFSFFIVLVYAAQPNMQEGKWEITTTMEMKNIPFKMPPSTHTQCFTKKDLEDRKKTTPSSGKDDKCEMTDYKMKGNTVSWKVKCKDGAEGSGTITYSGTSYSGTMKMDTVDKKGNKTTVNYKIKAKRVGNC